MSSFVVPTFPLTCNIWTGPWLAKVARLAAVPCNIGIGRRIAQNFFASAPVIVTVEIQLLLPKLTDIRDAACVGGADMVECPAGSGRWYWVAGVDDIGKGFANEHRMAICQKAAQSQNPVAFAGAFWPTPIP